jgi:hypothetical protein
MTDNFCGKTTIQYIIKSCLNEKKKLMLKIAQNRTNQRATKNAEEQSSADGDVDHKEKLMATMKDKG